MSANNFCTVFCEQLELVSEGFAPFYLTEQNKDVCEQKLEEQNKDVCEQKLQEQLFPSSLGQSRTDSDVSQRERTQF